MSDLHLLQGMGKDMGMDEGQNVNFMRVMAAQYDTTDAFRQEVVAKKLGNPAMLDYESGNGFGKKYLVGSYFTNESNRKNFSTPESSLKYLNQITSGDKPLMAPNKERLKQTETFIAEFIDKQKDPTETSKQLQTLLGVNVDGVLGQESNKAIANYLTIYGEETLKKNTLKTKLATAEDPKTKIINNLYNHFAVVEGNGDTTGAAPTGERGLTTSIYNAMKKKYGANITQEQASKHYLGDIYNKFESDLTGFKQLDDTVKEGIIDAAYNLSYTEMLTYPGFTAAVETGDKEEIFKSLLDTANSGAKSIKGLGKRRALSYNMVNTDSKITSVKQDADGTMTYYKGTEAYFTYKPKSGKHEKSSPGTLQL